MSKFVVNTEGQRDYTAQQMSPSAVLVPKGKEHLVPEGTPYIRILDEIPNQKFNPTETLVTFEMFMQYCYDVGIDIPDDQGWGREKRPVINVSSIDILYFINWVAEKTAELNEKTKMFEDNVKIVKPYILQRKDNDNWWIWMNPEIKELEDKGFEVHYPSVPTEDQWTSMLGDAQEDAENGNLDEIAWYAENSNGMTHPVAEKKANNYGIYDILGNTWKMVFQQKPPFMTPALWIEHNFPGKYMDCDWFGQNGNNAYASYTSLEDSVE